MFRSRRFQGLTLWEAPLVGPGTAPLGAKHLLGSYYIVYYHIRLYVVFLPVCLNHITLVIVIMHWLISYWVKPSEIRMFSSWARVGLGSAGSISSWLGMLVSIALRSSGPIILRWTKLVFHVSTSVPIGPITYNISFSI